MRSQYMIDGMPAKARLSSTTKEAGSTPMAENWLAKSACGHRKLQLKLRLGLYLAHKQFSVRRYEVGTPE